MSSSNQNLVSLFYNTLEPDLKKGKGKDYYSIKPSSLGTKCLRKLYYSSFRIPEDFDVPPHVKKMGAMGDGIAHILSNKYRSQGVLIDYMNPDGSYQEMFGSPNLEFPIKSDELGIKKGYIDAVLDMNNELWLGEYKSATRGSFHKLKGPKPDHLVQAVTYLFVFNKLLKDGWFKHIERLDKFDQAKGIRILYVNRCDAVDFQMKEFVVTLQDALQTFKEIVLKVSNFKQFADKKELPPKTPEWCSNCPWRAKCSENFNIK